MPAATEPPIQPESTSNPEPNPKRRRLTTMGPPVLPIRNADPGAGARGMSDNQAPMNTHQPCDTNAHQVPNASTSRASNASQVRRTSVLQISNIGARQAPSSNVQAPNGNTQPPTDALVHRFPFQNIVAVHRVAGDPRSHWITLPPPVPSGIPSGTPGGIPSAAPLPYIFLPITAVGFGLHQAHAEPKPKKRTLDYKVPELRYPPPFPIWFPSIETVPELASSYASGEGVYSGIISIGICKVNNARQLKGFHWALPFLVEDEGVHVDLTNNCWMRLTRPDHRYGWMLDPCAGYRSEPFVQFLDAKSINGRFKTDTRMAFRFSTSILYRLCLVAVMTSMAISQKRDELCRSVTTAKDMFDLEASTRAWCIYVLIGLPGVVEHHGFEPEGPAQGMCWRIEYDMRLATLAELGRAHKLYDNQALVNPGFVNNCKQCNVHLRRL